MYSPRLIADRFRSLELVGEGISGQAVRGEDTSADPPATVLLKFAVPTRAARNELDAERRALEALRDALDDGDVPAGAAPRLIHSGTHDGVPYIVAEFLEKPWAPLNERAQKRRFGELELVTIWFQLCELLVVAHGLGFIHNDLGAGKLEHLWWSEEREPNGRRLRVIDWANSAWPNDPSTNSPRTFEHDVRMASRAILALVSGSASGDMEKPLRHADDLNARWSPELRQLLTRSCGWSDVNPIRSASDLRDAVRVLRDRWEQDIRNLVAAAQATTDPIAILGSRDHIASLDATNPFVNSLSDRATKASIATARNWLDAWQKAISLGADGLSDHAIAHLDASRPAYSNALTSPGVISAISSASWKPAECFPLGIPAGNVSLRSPSAEDADEATQLLVTCIRALPPLPPDTNDAHVSGTRRDWLRAVPTARGEDASDLLVDALLPGSRALHRLNAAEPAEQVVRLLAARASWPPSGLFEAVIRGASERPPVSPYGTDSRSPRAWFVDWLDTEPMDSMIERISTYTIWVTRSAAAHQINHEQARLAGLASTTEMETWIDSLEHLPLPGAHRGAAGGLPANPPSRGFLRAWVGFDPPAAPLARWVLWNHARLYPAPNPKPAPSPEVARGGTTDPSRQLPTRNRPAPVEQAVKPRQNARPSTTPEPTRSGGSPATPAQRTPISLDGRASNAPRRHMETLERELTGVRTLHEKIRRIRAAQNKVHLPEPLPKFLEAVYQEWKSQTEKQVEAEKIDLNTNLWEMKGEYSLFFINMRSFQGAREILKELGTPITNLATWRDVFTRLVNVLPTRLDATS